MHFFSQQFQVFLQFCIKVKSFTFSSFLLLLRQTFDDNEREFIDSVCLIVSRTLEFVERFWFSALQSLQSFD